MGVDLILIPFGSEGETTISYTALELERNSSLWPEILALESRAVPEGFRTPFGHSYPDDPDYWDRDTSLDADDKPVRWVFAKELTAFRMYQDFPPESQNRAIWAYLEQLPPLTRIALFWY